MIWGFFSPIPSNVNITLLFISKLIIWKTRKDEHYHLSLHLIPYSPDFHVSEDWLGARLLYSCYINRQKWTIELMSLCILPQWDLPWGVLVLALAANFSVAHLWCPRRGCPPNCQEEGLFKYAWEKELHICNKWAQDQNLSALEHALCWTTLSSRNDLLILHTAQWNDFMVTFIF